MENWFCSRACKKLFRPWAILQSQSTSNPTSISQAAAEAALLGDQTCITPMLDAFKERHAYVVNTFNKYSWALNV